MEITFEVFESIPGGIRYFSNLLIYFYYNRRRMGTSICSN
jgi:hypothetical protein